MVSPTRELHSMQLLPAVCIISVRVCLLQCAHRCVGLHRGTSTCHGTPFCNEFCVQVWPVCLLCYVHLHHLVWLQVVSGSVHPARVQHLCKDVMGLAVPSALWHLSLQCVHGCLPTLLCF